MMKRTFLILLLSIGMATPSLCQHYFNVRDHFHSSSTVLTSVVERNGKYYCTGLCVDSSNYINNDSFVCWGIKFAIFDANGIKIRDTFYQKTYIKMLFSWTTSSLYSLNDGNFVLATQYKDTNRWKGYIIKLDSTGNKLWEKEYAQPFCPENEWYKVTDFKPTGTGEWLLLGDIYCDAATGLKYNKMALTKLDSNFNIIWSKEYGNPPKNHIPTKVLVEADGYLLAGGINDNNLVTGGSYYQPELIKVDTNGTWQWTWIRNLGGYYNAANDVIRTADGGYLYCGGGAGFIDFEPNFKGWVEKLDSDRHIVWNRSFNNYYWTTQFKVLKETPAGEILLFGDKYCPYRIDSNNVNVHTRGWYIKLSANGDSLAEHTYYYLRTCNEENKVYDVKQTTDGGFVLVGESADYCGGADAPVQRGWIVKIDSNGCIDPVTCDQQDVSTEASNVKTNSETIFVYPNPVKDLLQISDSDIREREITVTDVAGRVLINKKLEHSVDVHSLATGMYLYKVTEQGVIKAQGKILKE